MAMKTTVTRMTDLISQNWLYKIVALIVAIAVWATTIYGRKDAIMLKTLNLEYILKPNFAIENPYRRTVQVKVSGPRDELDTFAMSATPVVINLADRPPGENAIPILPSEVAIPLGVKVMAIQPQQIELVIQRTRGHYGTKPN